MRIGDLDVGDSMVARMGEKEQTLDRLEEDHHRVSDLQNFPAFWLHTWYLHREGLRIDSVLYVPGVLMSESIVDL